MRSSNGVSLPIAASTDKRARDQGRREHVLDREQAEQSERGRDLGAVHERESFLGTEADRQQREGQVGERCQSPDAPTEPFDGIGG